MKKNNRRPTPPGEILQEEFLKPLRITKQQCADHLGIDVKIIEGICRNKTVITPKIALLLSGAFNMTPGFWINAQTATDIWNVQQSDVHIPGSIN